MADVIAIVADGMATGWNGPKVDLITLVADAIVNFPIHQMKACQVDWQKLVILEKNLFCYREINLRIEN